MVSVPILNRFRRIGSAAETAAASSELEILWDDGDIVAWDDDTFLAWD